MAFGIDTFTDALGVFDAVKDTFDKYIVRPANSFGLGGFVFDVEGETSINLSTEITDHYTEKNVAIQDHIAIRPKKITLKTYVGELVYRLDGSTDTDLQKAIQKLTVVDDYLPRLSSAGQQIKRLLDGDQSDLSFNNLLNQASDIWALTKNLNPPIPRQQQAYMYFKALAEQKILVSLQTPFEYAANMAIETIIATQSEDSQWISDFSITLKEIRTVSTRNVRFDYTREAGDLQGRLAEQGSSLVNNGKTQGSTADLESTLFSATKGAFKSLF